MKSSTVLKAEVQDLANKMLRIAEDPRMPSAEKAAKMKAYQPQLEHAQSELADAKHVEAQINVLRGAGVSGDHGGQSGFAGAYGTKAVGAAPSILPSQDQMQELFEAVASRKSVRIEVKDTTNVSGQLPATLVPGIVPFSHEPTRVLDFIPSSPIASPTWEYIRHLSTTGTATTVAPGGLKPNVDMVTDVVTGTVRKIAATTTVEDESLADFSGFSGYVSEELIRIYTDQENLQLLLGDGTGTNILGLLNQSGILNRDYTADHTADATATGLDTLEQAVTQLRTGTAFAVADLIVMHPTTWSKLRRTKDSQGRYLVNPDPTAGEASRLWDKPVMTTTVMPVGTALVSQLAMAGEARIRQNITVESTPYTSDDWLKNKTSFRVEARVGLAVPKPAAVLKVVNL